MYINNIHSKKKKKKKKKKNFFINFIKANKTFY